MSAVDDAAGIIAADYRARHSGFEWGPYVAATALAGAGLLRPDWATDEAKAVLDAAVDWLGPVPWRGSAFQWPLPRAAIAYVASLEST